MWCLVVAAAILSSLLAQGEPTPPVSFDQWIDAFTSEWSGAATSKSSAESMPDEDDPEALFRDSQKARQKRRLALARKGLAGLDQFPRTALSATQNISAALLRWHLDTFVASDPFTDHLFVFRQLRGLHVTLVDSLTERSTIRKKRDVETYLERLGRVATQIDEGIARARAATDRGLIPRSTDDAGISERPGGAAAYAQALASFTTTRLTVAADAGGLQFKPNPARRCACRPRVGRASVLLHEHRC